MTEEEKDIIRLKNSILADQAINALLASIGEPPDTSFMDDLKKRGIPIPNMTGYVFQDTISDEEFRQSEQETYEEIKAYEKQARLRGEEVDDPIDEQRKRWSMLYQDFNDS